MRRLAIALLFLMSGSALAQSSGDVQMPRLEAALARVREEQQSVYQQFQMIQALQRAELQSVETNSALYVPDGQVPSYDDVARERLIRQGRIRYYTEELRQLSDRYRDLDHQVGPLLEQIR